MKVLNDLTSKEIKKYISNRYPYLLIDRVTEVVAGKYANGYKNFTANEWFFPVHFPENPIVPGMIQIEALLQMLSLSLLIIDGNEKKVVRVNKSNKIRLKKHIVPGSLLEIKSELIHVENDWAVGRASGFLTNVEACCAEFEFKLLDRSVTS